jgi:Thioredoxin
LGATAAAHSGISPALFDRGQAIEQFVQTTTRQRESWIRNVAAAKIDPGMVERFRRVGGDLRLLIVAEDWCPDSVHTVPYVAALAAQAGVEMRIVDRGSGAAMMKRHPPPDGRGVTPIVVLLRRGIDVGAWVERPSVLQSLFQSIGTNPEIWSSSLLKEHRSSR